MQHRAQKIALIIFNSYFVRLKKNIEFLTQMPIFGSLVKK